MNVKMEKLRSLTGKLPGWGTNVDDGYIRYISVDGQRFADVVKDSTGKWNAYAHFGDSKRKTVHYTARTQRELLAIVKADLA